MERLFRGGRVAETTERDWLEALDPWRYHFALTVDAGEGVYVPGPRAIERTDEALRTLRNPDRK